MRHPLVPALLVVLAVIGYALLGAVVVGASSAEGNPAEQSADTPTVSGSGTESSVQPATVARSFVPDVAGLTPATLALVLGLVRRTDRR